MTALRADINAETRFIPVSVVISNPTYPLFYDLGDETIKVVGRADTTEWEVERGAGDSGATSHTKGTVLIANASPFGAGGGEQRVRLLGPFNITFETANLGSSSGVELADLDAGVWVISSWALFTQEWTFLEPSILQIRVAPASDLTDWWEAAIYNTYASNGFFVDGDAAVLREGVRSRPDPDSESVTTSPLRAIVGPTVPGVLTVRVSNDPTAGEADIYALIAEPV